MGGKHRSKKRNLLKQQRKNQVGLVHKFAVDERVLCYEPDMNKARVLYDSKVLEVVERNQKGKITAEYKIHFFGWNSSWDRYVTEDCILKDTEQNKNLQKELKEKADVLLGVHVKKKKRKKTLSELLKEVTKDKNVKGDGKKGTSGDGDDSSNSSGSSDSSGEEESDEEDKVVSRIILTDKMKAILEQDYFNIMTKNMLVKVPAEFSVICVFEGYVKFIGFRELRKMVEQHKAYFTTSGQQQIIAAASTPVFSASGANTKTLNQAKTLNDAWAEDIARIYRKVRQAQEIVHGLKVIFDYMLYQMLLYDVENEQYKTHKRMRPMMPDINWLRRWFYEFKAYFSGFCSSMLVPRLPVPGSVTSKEDAKKKDPKKSDHETPSTSKAARAAAGTSKEHHSETLNKLRKHSKAAGEEKERKSDRKSKAGDASSLSPNLFDYVAWTRSINKYSSELQAWEMLPEDCYRQESPDPCMVYGLIHILRFFVKLPDILNRMLIPRRKVRIIANHVNQMIDHIQTAYAFSVSRLYVPIPRQVYEEDQIRIAAPPPQEKQVEVKVEVERDFSQYSTRNYQLIPLVKARPQLPKVVEVPLSTTETLEEHQLTINSEIPLPIPIPPEDTIEEIRNVTEQPIIQAKLPKPKEPPISKKPEQAPVTVAEKLKQDIKKEPISPPIKPEKASSSQPQTKKKPAAKPTVSPPVQPMVRQVRKSAAHAAFKNAHLFVSQQHLTARTIAASASTAAAAAANAVVKQEPDEEQASASTSSSSSRKRSLPSDAPVSAPKRVTRTSDVKPATSLTESGLSASKSFTNQNRKSRQEQRSSNDKRERRESDKKSSSKSPQGRRPSNSPVRKSRNSEGNHPSISKSTTARRTSVSSAPRSSTDRKRNKSKGEDEVEKKYVPPTDEKPKVEPRRISSPRPSKSGRDSSGSKDNRSPTTKTPQKSVSPTSTNTIRLRSRSDERQLRSKGALINALSLPMQSSTPRSSSYSRSGNSEAEKSPKRRESTGNKDTDPPFKRGQHKRN